jgi:NitT/TauT family transport system substrate-binding protein
MHSKKILLVLILSVTITALTATFLFFHKGPDKKLTKVNIAFQEWVGYGPFFLAQEKGFFKKEGIELFFVDEQLDSARRDAFKAGMLDCEGGTIDLLVSKTAQDTPIEAVLELDHSFGADGIVATEDIKTLGDLIGKKVVFSRDDVSDTLIAYLFNKNGLPMEGITIVSRNPEEVAQSFLNGEADAAVTWEPWLSKALQRKGAHILLSTKDAPEIIVDTLNIRYDIVKKHPELVKGLMRGWFEGLKYYKENPLEASTVIAPHYNITPEEYRKNVEGLKWVDYAHQVEPAQYDELINVFDSISDIKFGNKRIFKKPDARKILNMQLLKGLYHENSK